MLRAISSIVHKLPSQTCNLQVRDSKPVQLIIQLEQWLMEGTYNKVLEARSNVPDPSYAHFMEKLLDTIRYTPQNQNSQDQSWDLKVAPKVLVTHDNVRICLCLV